MSQLIIEQGSPEWHACRCGKATASRVADIMARGRSGQPSASRANYMAELVIERLTGRVEDGYKSSPMERGNEVEPEAIDAYEFYTGNTTELVGFVDHPTISMFGASPDRLVGEDGLVEVKCPNPATHLATLLGKNIPGVYIKQMQGQLTSTERIWCDWVSYDPRFPEEMRLVVRRVERNPELIVDMTSAVEVFLAELDGKVKQLRQLYQISEAAE